MAGGLFALLFILYTTYRVLRQRTGATWIQMLLAFGAIAAFGASINMQTMLILAVGGALAIAGAVFLLIERRRSQTDFNLSQGVFALGVSVLLLVSALIGPTIASTVSQITKEGVATAQEPTESMSAEVMPVLTRAPGRNDFATNTPVPTSTPASVEVSLPDPLPTRYVYVTPVPTQAVVNTAQCQGVTQNNLNLRAEPSAEAELLLTIPHSTDLPIYGRNADASWLYTGYEDRTGWVSAAYVILNADCGNLPVQGS